MFVCYTAAAKRYLYYVANDEIGGKPRWLAWNGRGYLAVFDI